MLKTAAFTAAIAFAALATTACSMSDDKVTTPVGEPIVSSQIVDTKTSDATVVQQVTPNASGPTDVEGKAPDVVVQDQETTTQTIETKKVVPVVTKRKK